MTNKSILQYLANLARKHSTFTNIEDMNVTVRVHIDNYNLSGKLKDFLMALKEYSCKYTGVSYRMRKRWAEQFEVSERTIKRWLDKLATMGVVKEVPVSRPNGRQLQNLVVILPVKKTEEKQEECGNVTPPVDILSPQENNTLKQNINKLNTRKESRIFDKDSVHTEVPKEFVNKLGIYFNDASIIEGFWNRFKLAFTNHFKTGNNEAIITPEENVDKAINIALAVVKSAKEGRLKKGTSMDAIFSAFYGLCKKKCTHWSRQFIRDMGNQTSSIPMFNWLDDSLANQPV